MKKNFFIGIFLIVILFSISYLVSQRDISIGADTDSYKYYFSVIMNADNFGALSIEPGFFLLNKISAFISDRFQFFLFFEYILFNLVYYIFFKEFSKYLNLEYSTNQILLFVGFTLFSSWYILFSLNGLRQGLATPLVYLSFIFFLKNKYLFSIFTILLAFFIHSSSLLIFPFFFLYRLNFKLLFFLFFFTSISYFLFLNKLLINFLSNVLGFSELYYYIIGYGGINAPDYGPQLRFLIYTLGVPFFIYLFSRKFLKKNNFYDFKNCLKFYFVLCFPFFLFAYGGYSGRLALYSWFLIPFIYSFVFSRSVFFKRQILFFSIIIFLLGIVNYVLLLNLYKLPIYLQDLWGNV